MPSSANEAAAASFRIDSLCGFLIQLKILVRGARHQGRIDPLLYHFPGDHALGHVAPAGKLEHDVGERRLDDGAQAAGPGLQLQGLPRDGVERVLGENELNPIVREELVVLLA